MNESSTGPGAPVEATSCAAANSPSRAPSRSRRLSTPSWRTTPALIPASRRVSHSGSARSALGAQRTSLPTTSPMRSASSRSRAAEPSSGATRRAASDASRRAGTPRSRRRRSTATSRASAASTAGRGAADSFRAASSRRPAASIARASNNARVRYLDEAERSRLLAVCRMRCLVAALFPRPARAHDRGAQGRAARACAGATSTSSARRPTSARARTASRACSRSRPPSSKRSSASVRAARRASSSRATAPRAADADRARVPRGRAPRRGSRTSASTILRHTAASYAAQSGASLLEIADLLGHRQLSMVRRYAHLSTQSKAQLVARVFAGVK